MDLREEVAKAIRDRIASTGIECGRLGYYIDPLHFTVDGIVDGGAIADVAIAVVLEAAAKMAENAGGWEGIDGGALPPLPGDIADDIRALIPQPPQTAPRPPEP